MTQAAARHAKASTSSAPRIRSHTIRNSFRTLQPLLASDATRVHVDIGIGAGPKGYRKDPDGSVTASEPVPIRTKDYKGLVDATATAVARTLDDSGCSPTVLTLDIPGPESDPIKSPGVYTFTNAGGIKADIRTLGKVVAGRLGLEFASISGCNDADAAVLGMVSTREAEEFVRQSGATAKYPAGLLGLTLGGGIGSAKVLAWVDSRGRYRVKLLTTNRGTAEVGHTGVHGVNLKCNCDRTGCVEKVASSNGIARTANTALKILLERYERWEKFAIAYGDLDESKVMFQPSSQIQLKTELGSMFGDLIVPLKWLQDGFASTEKGDDKFIFINGKHVHATAMKRANDLREYFEIKKTREADCFDLISNDPELQMAKFAWQVLELAGGMLGHATANALIGLGGSAVFVTGGGSDLKPGNPFRKAFEGELASVIAGMPLPTAFWMPQTGEMNYAALGGFMLK